MKITVAKSAGFCFGVSRSVEMAEQALATYGETYCLGELIHNRDEVARLSAMGLHVVHSPEEVPKGAVALIRSHGVGPAVLHALQGRARTVIDATCPRVAHIHRLVEEASEKGHTVLILGREDHPEVQAIAERCAKYQIFPDDVALGLAASSGTLPKEPVTVVFQTTQTKKVREGSKKILQSLYTNFEFFDTICSATQVRQAEALALAGQCDAMIVIGARHSANSTHLAELCRERCGAVAFVENAADLDLTSLKGYDTILSIGITAGASVPARIIKEVKQMMSDEIRDEIRDEVIDDMPETVEAEEAVDELSSDAENMAEPEFNAESEANNDESAEAENAENAESIVASDAETPNDSEKSFAELLEDSIRTISNGDTVRGVVAAITATEISVDLGTKQSGYIPVQDFSDNPNDRIEDLVHIGDTVEACVVRVNDAEGTVALSKRRLDSIKHWNDLEAAAESGGVVEGKVTEENKGGVVVNVKGVRVFVPASQSGLPRDASMSELVGQTVRVKITEVHKGRRRVVGSIRAVAAKERRERADKIWSEIDIGKHYDGVVKSLTSYGAFVDIGGVDGMVHVSELSWKRIGKPADVVSVGDEINVYVIGFDKEHRKISLGYKDPNANPWTLFTDSYSVGSIASVRIVKLMNFGAFAEVVPGVDGLIHISQIANRRIARPDEVLSVGDVVDAKITGIDEGNHKVSLSIRAVNEPEQPQRQRRNRQNNSNNNNSNSSMDDDDIRREPIREKAQADALVYEVSERGEVTGQIPDGIDV